MSKASSTEIDTSSQLHAALAREIANELYAGQHALASLRRYYVWNIRKTFKNAVIVVKQVQSLMSAAYQRKWSMIFAIKSSSFGVKIVIGVLADVTDSFDRVNEIDGIIKVYFEKAEFSESATLIDEQWPHAGIVPGATLTGSGRLELDNLIKCITGKDMLLLLRAHPIATESIQRHKYYWNDLSDVAATQSKYKVTGSISNESSSKQEFEKKEKKSGLSWNLEMKPFALLGAIAAVASGNVLFLKAGVAADKLTGAKIKFGKAGNSTETTVRAIQESSRSSRTAVEIEIPNSIMMEISDYAKLQSARLGKSVHTGLWDTSISFVAKHSTECQQIGTVLAGELAQICADLWPIRAICGPTTEEYPLYVARMATEKASFLTFPMTSEEVARIAPIPSGLNDSE